LLIKLNIVQRIDNENLELSVNSGVKMYSRDSVESLRGNSCLLAARFITLEDANIAEYVVNVIL
jgi:hypothetical protein